MPIEQLAHDQFPEYEVNIGIEVHVQLLTKSKIFCSCPNEQSDIPNKNICEICAGHPGTLPMLNRSVVEYGIKAALATNSTINTINRFARKHYFYPDLPKNFQITQADEPIAEHGSVTIRKADGEEKTIRLIRIHMEEDAGKSIHATTSDESYIDLNRAGTPLLEIVSHPDIANADEAKAYLRALRLIVTYLNISSGNMEEGAFRADTNISVRKRGAKQLGTKCELKNINSFKFIGDAIDYEVERQINLLESGGKIAQETRLWDTRDKKTILMRVKEEANDYRYLIEPDIPPLHIQQSWIDEIKKQLPELPDQKWKRLCQQYGLSSYEADILINEPPLCDYYENICTHYVSDQTINWIMRDLISYLKDNKIIITNFTIEPIRFAQLMECIDKKIINNRTAQTIFLHMLTTTKDPLTIIKEQNLEQQNDASELEKLVQEIIANNPHQVAEYRSGKQKLFSFFVGQMMSKTKGKSDPVLIQQFLKKFLE